MILECYRESQLLFVLHLGQDGRLVALDIDPSCTQSGVHEASCDCSCKLDNDAGRLLEEEDSRLVPKAHVLG